MKRQAAIRSQTPRSGAPLGFPVRARSVIGLCEHWIVATLLATALLFIAPSANAASRLADFLDKFPPGEIVPGADRLGPVSGDPPAAPAYQGGQLVGYVFLNSDVVSAVGYSGKPIHIAIGLDTTGKIVGTKLLEHHEPIVLIGIPEKRMTDFIARYIGRNVLQTPPAEQRRAPVDAVSGATVTVMVIDDTVVRSARKIARTRALGGLQAPAGGQVAQARQRQVDISQTGTADWESLVKDGSVARLRLTIGQVNEAFAELAEEEGDEAREELAERAAERPEPGDPGDTFIDLYVAPVSVPVIGRSLLGEQEYQALQQQLQPGQHALVIAAKGRYSFRGSGYVRGGIFDRIHLLQNDTSVRFHDRDYRRIGDLAAKGAPRLQEIGLFLIPPDAGFDPARPWQLQLLVQRAATALEKVFTTFEVGYTLPDKYLTPAPVAGEFAAAEPAPERGEPEGEELWLRIWRERIQEIAVLVVALVILTLIFFFQDWLVRRPRLTNIVRTSFLLFTLFWLGWYANAQLSVVNVLTLSNALLTDFRWEFFLMDPLLFILWSATAVALLFWGRGPFCGWLCPFGALQEFANRIAKYFKVPQVHVPWGVHERLWPIKYLIFVGLLGLSLYSLAWAERLSEVEPFKTAIILDFIRDWPFVVYAVALLVVGLFIERFFCRYLCPLGAALAIPGRMRMFEWLKRYKECGNPCQRCGNECMVQSIHPEGHINPNECIYCLHCQTLYYDDHRCPVMIQRRLRRERASARATKDPEVIARVMAGKTAPDEPGG